MTLHAVITPLPANRFPNKLAPSVSNNMLRNSSLCYFALFLVASLPLFINKADSLKDLTILMISFISSLEIMNVVIPDQKIFF